MLCRHRKTMIKILKTIRCCTGSQWSEWRIGVMWEDLLVSVMSLAAEFWRRWRRWIWYSGRFMRTPFEKSRREEMSEWTRHSVVLRVRYLRMWDILRSWNLTLLQMVEMWWLKVISVSKVTPRLRHFSLGKMSESPILIGCLGVFFMDDLEPKRMNSDFASFNFKLFWDIQSLTADTHNSSRWLILVSFFSGENTPSTDTSHYLQLLPEVCRSVIFGPPCITVTEQYVSLFSHMQQQQ